MAVRSDLTEIDPSVASLSSLTAAAVVIERQMTDDSISSKYLLIWRIRSNLSGPLTAAFRMWTLEI
jgi:hypothetical protein